MVAALRQSGELEAVVAQDPGVVATVGMSYASQPILGAQAIANYGGDHRAAAVRYGLRVISGSAPVAPLPGTDWGDVEKVVTWGSSSRGDWRV